MFKCGEVDHVPQVFDVRSVDLGAVLTRSVGHVPLHRCVVDTFRPGGAMVGAVADAFVGHLEFGDGGCGGWLLEVDQRVARRPQSSSDNVP